MDADLADSPRAAALRAERSPRLPAGGGERFAGYGVPGVTFASGHVLALRRFPASSIGPAYTAVWHRDPAGAWTFYSDVEPALACARYFGSAGSRAVRDEIDLAWRGDFSLSVGVRGARLAWILHLAPTRATRLAGAVAARVPGALWRGAPLRAAFAGVGARVLGIGRFALDGRTPLGQRFSLVPERFWAVDAGAARLDGEHLGPVAEPREQPRLGDFRIPRRGVFMLGRASFQPAPEPLRAGGARTRGEYRWASGS